MTSGRFKIVLLSGGFALSHSNQTTMLYTILIGFIIGFLAKWILPGKDPGDGKGFVPILITILIGVVGSFLGGRIAALAGIGGGGLILSLVFGVAGAILLLLVYRFIMKATKK